jgi:hypothetical protein
VSGEWSTATPALTTHHSPFPMYHYKALQAIDARKLQPQYGWTAK